ncbi:hypothetical protein JG688_00008992 [Phytophthora aleatoria]|uniref:Uncharacterized protein n=1 Tax=Phytophthora aleatoria TaxID=2496075 RepID=A0A8J5J455_9STRA|nr:hypothetical protein JG688_00008992 [Phytophthora aleatoria]
MRTFEHDVDAQGSTTKKSFGVVVTSRTCLRNVVYAHRGQGQANCGVTDGTYRLLFGYAFLFKKLV